MSIAYLMLLALVQGLTEFLPVSSSGHLVLLPKLLDAKDQGILIDVALHIGTLCAILVYYRRDVFDIAFSFLFWKRGRGSDAQKLGLCILAGTIPAVLFGALLNEFFDDGIRSVAVIAATTLVFGVLMGFADRFGKKEYEVKDITLQRAVIIGLAQMIALIPGTSRSGITMTAARFIGFKRVDAARFSFLLGIPAMAAAGALSIFEMFQADDPGLWHAAALAVVFAFVVGLAAIHFMMVWLRNFGLLPFVIYRLVLGGVLVATLF